MLTLTELLSAMKKGEDVPLGVIADALRDEGREEEANWVQHKTRMYNSEKYVKEHGSPNPLYSSSPLRWWFQVWNTGVISKGLWAGGYATKAYEDYREAVMDLGQFLERVLVNGESRP